MQTCPVAYHMETAEQNIEESPVDLPARGRMTGQVTQHEEVRENFDFHTNATSLLADYIEKRHNGTNLDGNGTETVQTSKTNTYVTEASTRSMKQDLTSETGTTEPLPAIENVPEAQVDWRNYIRRSPDGSIYFATGRGVTHDPSDRDRRNNKINEDPYFYDFARPDVWADSSIDIEVPDPIKNDTSNLLQGIIDGLEELIIMLVNILNKTKKLFEIIKENNDHKVGSSATHVNESSEVIELSYVKLAPVIVKKRDSPDLPKPASPSIIINNIIPSPAASAKRPSANASSGSNVFSDILNQRVGGERSDYYQRRKRSNEFTGNTGVVYLATGRGVTHKPNERSSYQQRTKRSTNGAGNELEPEIDRGRRAIDLEILEHCCSPAGCSVEYLHQIVCHL